MIPTESVLIQIGLEVLPTNCMVSTPNAPLHQRPETLQGVGMDIPVNVDFGLVVDTSVVITHPVDPIIAGKLIGVDGRGGEDMFPNHRQQGICAHIGNDLGNDASLPFDRSADNGLTSSTPSPLPWVSPANIGLVHFDGAREGNAVFLEEFPNLGEHPPGSFVGYTDFSLEMFRRDATARRSHKECSMKPKPERGCGFLIDGARCGVNMVSAVIATVGASTGYLMVLGDSLTVFTEDSIGIEEVLEPF